jgi:hypothetical protein
VLASSRQPPIRATIANAPTIAAVEILRPTMGHSVGKWHKLQGIEYRHSKSPASDRFRSRGTRKKRAARWPRAVQCL